MSAGKNGIGIVAVAALGAALALWGVGHLTATSVEDGHERARLAILDALLGDTRYDNDLALDVTVVRNAELLGGSAPRRVYRALYQGQPAAAVLETVAPGGYSGAIALLVAIDMERRVLGVRIVAHRETAGLGDQIETTKSDWLLDFAGRSLGDPPAADWSVRRDGGHFDQFTGATVTPRAVVEAVRDALLYFDTHAEAVFAAPVSPPDTLD